MISIRQLTRHATATPFLGADHGAAKVEQLLWNQCNGRVCDTRTIARMRFGVVCPPVNWSVGRADSFGDPNKQAHPVVNSPGKHRAVNLPKGPSTHSAWLRGPTPQKRHELSDVTDRSSHCPGHALSTKRFRSRMLSGARAA